MSIIQQKLKDNKSKMRREKILSAINSTFSDLLSQAECENVLSCMSNKTHQELDNNVNENTTTPGGAICCNTFTFRSWPELITVLKRFQQVKNYIGWFFLDREGPYFKISLNAFLSSVSHISNYGAQNDHYYFGWVGDLDNVGIIIEKRQMSPNGKRFCITIWGI